MGGFSGDADHGAAGRARNGDKDVAWGPASVDCQIGARSLSTAGRLE